jgi:regulator of PEP synthase PpsR (kinase-PPPase family)
MHFMHLHLISDSTGETVNSVARAALAQFEDVDVQEHSWSLVRTTRQVDRVLEEIKNHPGFVMYTLADSQLRRYFRESCHKLRVPCVSVLSRVIADLSSYLGQETKALPGKQYELDEEYFSRVEAINFTLTHDDGQSTWDLEEADIVIVGVSRTSKSPTSVYLAYRGYRTANIPYVPGVALPESLDNLQSPLIVGLTISEERLIQIRKSRLLSINADDNTQYVDPEKVKEEIIEAKRYFNKRKWPILDVTRRSVEESSAAIIELYQDKKKRKP